MGLIKAAKDAVSTVLADQWLEYFYCDSLSSDILMTKGQKRVNEKRNSNKKASDNIISNGSVIAVNSGQCMIIVDQGAVTEVCADEGEFVYDSSTEPSIFAGNLGENVVNTFKKVGRRIAFGGNTAHDQRVYYFNTKEIMHNLFGTATPIDFHLVSPNTGLELDTTVRCNGEYTFRIVDPITFYRNVCANVTDSYSKKGEGADLMSIMKKELLTKLPFALSKIAAEGVLPYQVAGRAQEIADYLKEALSEPWTEERGIEVASMTIECSTPAEDREKLNKWNETVMLRSGDMQQAAMTEATAAMVKNAQIGGGKNGGGTGMDAMMGMFSVNMMQNMMNGGMGGMGAMNGQMNNGQMGQQMQAQAAPQMQPQSAAVLGWTCSCGHTDNRGKFCAECGSPKPADAGWTCSCGEVNQGKFCSNCGSKKPAGAPLYKCDKCGWEPEDPTKPPKFCPECGDVFDENDIQ